MSPVTIFHNPRCGTSRTVLSTLRERGIEPTVVLYLETPPDRAALESLMAQLQVPARALLREKEALCTELGLLDAACPEARVLDAIAAHPILLNRPIVVTSEGGAVCRPASELDRLFAPR